MTAVCSWPRQLHNSTADGQSSKVPLLLEKNMVAYSKKEPKSRVSTQSILNEGQIIFNRSIEEISQRLCIEILNSEPEFGDALYTEKTLEGYKTVLENPGYSESYIDLEMLFNTDALN